MSEGEDETRHYRIHQNKDRLLYYVQETNEGKGFIKVIRSVHITPVWIRNTEKNIGKDKRLITYLRVKKSIS